MATRLSQVAAALRKMPRDIVEDAVDRFDEMAKESASRVVGGGATMRMHTRRGRVPVKLGTRSKVSGGGSTVTAFIDGVPKAQWVWIEDGTKPHSVGRRGSYLKAPTYPHPIMGPVSHPGTQPGRKAWTRAINEFEAEYPDIGMEHLRKAL